MDASQLFPSKYMKAADLNNKEITLTIDSVGMEQFKDESDKAILFLKTSGGEKLSKGLILNKTNINTLVTAYGKETEEWEGKQIIVYPTETQFEGRSVACIRLRRPLEASDGSEIPF